MLKTKASESGQNNKLRSYKVSLFSSTTTKAVKVYMADFFYFVCVFFMAY